MPLAANKRPHVLNYARAVEWWCFWTKIVFTIGDRYRYFCTIYRTSSPAWHSCMHWDDKSSTERSEQNRPNNIFADPHRLPWWYQHNHSLLAAENWQKNTVLYSSHRSTKCRLWRCRFGSLFPLHLQKLSDSLSCWLLSPLLCARHCPAEQKKMVIQERLINEGWVKCRQGYREHVGENVYTCEPLRFQTKLSGLPTCFM